MAPYNSTFQSGWIATHNILKKTRTPPVSDVGETANFGAAVISALGQQHQRQRGRAPKCWRREAHGAPRREEEEGWALAVCRLLKALLDTLQPWEPRRYLEVTWTEVHSEKNPFIFSLSLRSRAFFFSRQWVPYEEQSKHQQMFTVRDGWEDGWAQGASYANTSEPIVNAVNNFTSLYVSEGLCLSFLKFCLVNSYWICARKTQNRPLSLVSYYSSEMRQPNEKARCVAWHSGGREGLLTCSHAFLGRHFHLLVCVCGWGTWRCLYVTVGVG